MEKCENLKKTGKNLEIVAVQNSVEGTVFGYYVLERVGRPHFAGKALSSPLFTLHSQLCHFLCSV